jgi:Mrp family chromosome partitioning ATPase
LRSAENDTLFFLPAGPKPNNPAELLGGEAFRQLLADAMQKFDFVFLDSPSALLVTDARVISQVVDAIVVVVRAGLTSKQSLNRIGSWISASCRGYIGACLNDPGLTKTV